MESPEKKHKGGERPPDDTLSKGVILNVTIEGKNPYPFPIGVKVDMKYFLIE